MQERFFSWQATGITSEAAISAHNAVAGNDDGQRVLADGCTHGSGRLGCVDCACNVGVRAGVTACNATQGQPHLLLKYAALRIERDIEPMGATVKVVQQFGRCLLQHRVGGIVRCLQRAGVVALAFKPHAAQAVLRSSQQHGAHGGCDGVLRHAGSMRGMKGRGHAVLPRNQFAKLFHSRSAAYERQGCQAWARNSAARGVVVLNKLDMVPTDERAARVADFVKRFRYKGPVFEISALTREGCESLIKAIFKHISAQHFAEQAPVDIDPRFAGKTEE